MAKLMLLVMALSFLIAASQAHGGHGVAKVANCNGAALSMAVLEAQYVPGAITVDGASSDWDSIGGHQFALYPALDPASEPYPGKMTIKVAHDGRDLFFLLQVPGNYQFKQGDKHNSPSLALMFPIGDDAVYVDMGGCSESYNCSRADCGGHEVDIMHFSTSNAIPGRIYGANLIDNINGTGKESAGALHDLYAWNPHCRYYDGFGPEGFEADSGAQNDWKGVWSHTSIANEYGLTAYDTPYGKASSTGIYIFELSRPLRTSDRLQQDAQFSIGKSHNLAAAFWFPMHGSPWSPIQHFSANCEWIPMRISAASGNGRAGSSAVATSISTFSLLLAVGSLVASAAIFWRLRSGKQVSFTPLGNDNGNL